MKSQQDWKVLNFILAQTTQLRAIICICIFAITFTHTVAIAGQGSLQQCQNINKKIDYYTALRRKGGSAKTMETWKQKRNDYKERYKEKACRKWADKL